MVLQQDRLEGEYRMTEHFTKNEERAALKLDLKYRENARM
jgi:hypothetical protein